MNVNIGEITSPSSHYKVILEKHMSGSVKISVLKWNFDPRYFIDKDVIPYWDNASDSVTFAESDKAEKIAREELERISGERIGSDQILIPLTIEWIQGYTNCTKIEDVNPDLYKIYFSFDHKNNELIIPKTIIEMDDNYLIEDSDRPGNWLLGKRGNGSEIVNCSSSFSSLKKMIESIDALRG